MKKYLSLATAILVGAVKASETFTTDSFASPALLRVSHRGQVAEVRKHSHPMREIYEAYGRRHSRGYDHSSDLQTSSADSSSSEREVQVVNERFRNDVDQRGHHHHNHHHRHHTHTRSRHSRHDKIEPLSNVKRFPSAVHESGHTLALKKRKIYPGVCRLCRARGIKAACWWTGKEWEWKNKWERDDTPDSGLYTSVGSDASVEDPGEQEEPEDP